MIEISLYSQWMRFNRLRILMELIAGFGFSWTIICLGARYTCVKRHALSCFFFWLAVVVLPVSRTLVAFIASKEVDSPKGVVNKEYVDLMKVIQGGVTCSWVIAYCRCQFIGSTETKDKNSHISIYAVDRIRSYVISLYHSWHVLDSTSECSIFFFCLAT